MSEKIQEGDKVSWSWGGNHPSGTAAEVKPGEVTVTSHRGNDISKTGDESSPAVHIERPGNDVVKTADELKVESKGSADKETNGATNGTSAPKSDEKEDKEEEQTEKENEEKEEKKEPEKAKTGDKRTAAPTTDSAPKAQKKTNGTEEKKKPGRPKTSNAPKKEKKVPAVGKAQRKTRSQGSA